MSEYYGKINNKSTATSTKDYSRIEGEGSCRSNDRDTCRSLAEGLPACVDHGNQIAYEMHARSKGWIK